MSKLVGVLRGRKIYDNDPALVELQCDVKYFPVRDGADNAHTDLRCDYCGRSSRGDECASCGAPLG